ncbi:hypothetical protein PQ462_10210 [Flavobacterium sp. KACC 22758]|uniref:hypothetical protein n=1 Tax=Flavobacterium sp. KACC 22758 TaxID=3025667 RepID=UPI0023670A60|nr:hypothetical protein [Flavobacterium sp. KACC 22758]WDF61743.1 hypothetical protein PQ462_10210 [Flavobacterium sp. KACC 22758]
MESKNYFLAISGLINELILNKNINITKYSIKSGYPEHYIKFLEEENNVIIADPIKAFYNKIGSVEIQWDSANGDLDLFGEINIVDIDQFLNLKNYQEYWMRRFNESNDEEQNKFMLMAKPFDYFNSDETEIAFFKQTDNQIKDKLYYFKSGYGYSNLNLSIDEYFDKIIETKGLTKWQELFLIGKFEEIQNSVKMIFNKDN